MPGYSRLVLNSKDRIVLMMSGGDCDKQSEDRIRRVVSRELSGTAVFAGWRTDLVGQQDERRRLSGADAPALEAV